MVRHRRRPCGRYNAAASPATMRSSDTPSRVPLPLLRSDRLQRLHRRATPGRRNAGEHGHRERGHGRERVRPRQLLSLDEFLVIVTSVYRKRNGQDFFFEGEEPE